MTSYLDVEYFCRFWKYSTILIAESPSTYLVSMVRMIYDVWELFV